MTINVTAGNCCKQPNRSQFCECECPEVSTKKKTYKMIKKPYFAKRSSDFCENVKCKNKNMTINHRSSMDYCCCIVLVVVTLLINEISCQGEFNCIKALRSSCVLVSGASFEGDFMYHNLIYSVQSCWCNLILVDKRMNCIQFGEYLCNVCD